MRGLGMPKRREAELARGLENRHPRGIVRGAHEQHHARGEDHLRHDVPGGHAPGAAGAQDHPAQVQGRRRQHEREQRQHLAVRSLLREQQDDADETRTRSCGEREPQPEHRLRDPSQTRWGACDVSHCEGLRAGVDDDREPDDDRGPQRDEPEPVRLERSRHDHHGDEAEHPGDPLAEGERSEVAGQRAPVRAAAPDRGRRGAELAH
jgi:hypothetical protein